MRRSLGAAVGVAIAVMAALALIRWSVWSYGTDTGTFAQVALNAFSGFTDGPERGTHFRFHWSPILALLWPIVATTRSPLSIQFVQVILVAIAAIPLAAIVRAYAGETWGTRAGILALVYPPLLSAAFEEFHELAFYPVVALALFWAADRARWLWFALFSIAAVLIREDASLDLFVIGIGLGAIGLLKRRSTGSGLLAGEPIAPERLTAAGFALAALSAATLAFYAYVVVPRSGGWAPSHFYRYTFANGPAQTLLAIVAHPAELAASIITPGRFTYLLEAIAPLAFLPFSTRWIWLAVPGLAGVLLASDAIVWRMGFHYELLWAPWLLLAACWALTRMVRRGHEAAARRWWIATVSICAAVLAAFNPMHPGHYLVRAAYQDSPSVVRAFACVPKSAPVATHDEWFAHEAVAYPNSTTIEADAGEWNGYIVYTPQWRNAYLEAHVAPMLRAARASGRYSVICRAGDVVVLRSSRTME